LKGIKMSLIDIKEIEKDARLEIAKEIQGKAKTALVRKLRDLEASKQIVRNIESQIEDLKASIADGSFTG